ncbi:MAG: pseudouridine-5'-phosphate glycosidase [Flavobacteriales bacterium]
MKPFLSIHSEIQSALKNDEPVVALESTIVAHGMPYPENLETAQRLESLVRTAGAVPATIAVANGQLQIGCDAELLHSLATEQNVWKVSRRDLPMALAGSKLGATTVSGTLIGANLAGISVFATGGIGGVHRDVANTWDISADITELAQSRVAVVSAGAKSILDLPKTLEALETAGVTVIGYKTNEFPAFFVRESGLQVRHQAQSPGEIARAMHAKWTLGLDGGFLVANPIPGEFAADSTAINHAIELGLEAAANAQIQGKDLTPFLLRFINEVTDGKSLASNRKLVENNVSVGAQLAVEFARLKSAE